MSQERFLNDLKLNLTKNKIYSGFMPPQFLRILVKFGLPINTSEGDSYSKEFYDNLQKYIFNLDHKEHQYPIIFTQEPLELIERFIKMYENDSDSNLIRMVLNNFYKWGISQPEQAMVYLENFIIIKNAFPNFVLKHKEYCQEISGVFLNAQICSIYDYSVFNHELGHAIHHFAGNEECPKHIQMLIEKFKSDPNTPARIQAYASGKREMLEDYFQWIWKNDFYSYINEVYPGGKDGYENTIREGYQKNIDNPDKIFADVVMRGGLKYLTPENISGDVPVDWKTYHQVTLENDSVEFCKRFSIFKFRSIFQLEGLIDALFEGKWLGNKIDGVTERCYMGHSSAYFQLDSSMSFRGVYAFFSSLITTSSFDWDEVVKDLRFVLGDELYEALFEYYKDLNKTK